MSNANLLSHRIEKIHGRLSELYRTINAAPTLSVELLPTALVELGIVSEALQLAVKELGHQGEKLNKIQAKLTAAHHRYQCLSRLLPQGYLVTEPGEHLLIQEASATASRLLNQPQEALIGKSLLAFIHPDEQALLQAKLSQINQRNQTEIPIRCQRQQFGFFEAVLTVEVSWDSETELPVLRWLLHDAVEYREKAGIFDFTNYNLYANRPCQTYCRGETIPIEPEKLWLVVQGVVKLTTLSERGEEMLVGLAQESMVFGSHLTALQIYQAMALTKVKLVSIGSTEISQSAPVAQKVLPLITRRLRQTEKFMSIYGQLRTEERFNRLLELLAEEIGQPVEGGVRLSARLTHQDLASACCTTRVTITRLLGKLQQQGRIKLDTQNHIVVFS
jgi:CRP-like cAMP-binding protein